MIQPQVLDRISLRRSDDQPVDDLLVARPDGELRHFVTHINGVPETAAGFHFYLLEVLPVTHWEEHFCDSLQTVPVHVFCGRRLRLQSTAFLNCDLTQGFCLLCDPLRYPENGHLDFAEQKLVDFVHLVKPGPNDCLVLDALVSRKVFDFDAPYKESDQMKQVHPCHIQLDYTDLAL